MGSAPHSPSSSSSSRAGHWSALLFTLCVHAGLALVLFFGVQWKASHPDVMEVELWAERPIVAASRAPEITGKAQEAKAPPQPKPEPPPPPPPPPAPMPAPKPAPVPQAAPSKSVNTPDIALQKEKEEKAKAEKEKAEREKAVQEKAKAEKAKQEKAEKEKAEKEKAEQEKRKQEKQLEQERQRKIAEDLKREEAERRKAAADKARKARLAAMKAMAGDESSNARRSAANTRRSMAAYENKIRIKIRGNIVLPPSINGNPKAIFEIQQLPTGEIVNVRLKSSSGMAVLDAAIERAIHKSSPLPKPDDPALFQRSIFIEYKPYDD